MKLRISLLSPYLAAALIFAMFSATGLGDGDHVKVALGGDATNGGELDPMGKFYRSNTYPLSLSKGGVATFYGAPGFFSSPFGIYQGNGASKVKEVAVGYDHIDVNKAGQAVILTGSGDTSAILAVVNGATRPVTTAGGAAGGDGFFQSGAFSDLPTITESGQIALVGKTTGSGQGVFLATPKGAGFTLERIAKLGDDAKDGGTFTAFNPRAVVTGPASGVTWVAFNASTTGSAGSGLYLGSKNGLIRVAANQHTDLKVNNVAQLVFVTNGAIYLGSTAGATAVVSSGDPAPDGGPFGGLNEPIINDAGEIAFTGTANGVEGIFVRAANGSFRRIADATTTLEGGTLGSLGKPELNNAGQVMFTAAVHKSSTDLPGIFIGDGRDVIKLIGVGDALLDSVVALQSGFFSSSGPEPAATDYLPEHGSLNAGGQVAYHALLANKKVGVFISTPSLHWRSGVDGAWADASNWTLGLAPDAAHRVSIDTATDVEVTGPTATTTVRELKVGGSTGACLLVLQPSATLNCTLGASVAQNGILAGTGTIGGSLALGDGAKVSLQIGGRGRGADYDFIKATAMQFGGALEVTGTGGFVPQLGDTFDLLDFGAHTAAFQSISLPPLAGTAFVWDAQVTPVKLYASGRVAVTLAPGLIGAYSGFVSAPGGAAAGRFQVTALAADGTIKAKLVFENKGYSVAGKIDGTGAFTSKELDKRTHAIVKLRLDLNNPDGLVTGTLEDAGGVRAMLTADRTPVYLPRTLASPYAGSYTFLLPADPAQPGPGYPQGTGFGTLAVSPNGAARLAGVLGDGTAVSAGGAITGPGRFEFFIPLYAKGGSVAGTIQLRGASSNNLVDGTLAWRKPLQVKAKRYAAAFSGSIAVEGSGFVPVKLRPSNLYLTGATLSFTSGKLGTITAPLVTLDTLNKVSFASPTSIRLDPLKTQFITGSFPVPVGAKTSVVKYKGVVLQKQNRAGGLFTGDGETGVVDLR